ncbi:MAG: hypothetical protein LBV15_04540 [Planctomycetota bacterium]|nr:hypothetical protein [Planctomycetota bacterium]
MSRKKTLLLVLYIIGYAAFRWNGDIVHQEVDLRASSVIGRRHIVGAGPALPHWLRQTHRVLFSPLMVAEEEGWWLADEAGEAARSAGVF